MDEIVARCQDCGREDRDPFTLCPWCGRKEPSRWWCVVCNDWCPARSCLACCGGLGVPAELFLGACVVGEAVSFTVLARNSGKKPVRARVSSPDAGVAIASSNLLVPAGSVGEITGKITVSPGPVGRRFFRLVLVGIVVSETVLVVDAGIANPQLEFVPATVTLHTPNPGSIVRTSVFLRNTGNIAVTAKLVATSNWLTPERKLVALAPGNSTEVKLRAKSRKTDAGTLEANLVADAPGGPWGCTVRFVLPDPELAANPVVFGDLKPGRPTFADVIISNIGRVKVECTLSAVHPWLQVLPTRIALPPGRSKTVRARASLTTAHDGLQSSELVLSSPVGVVLRIPVTATGVVPKPLLRAVRRQRIRDAVGPPVERKFQIVNDGDGRLELTATADKSWVKIVTPILHVAPGKKRKLRYVIDLPTLPRGEHNATITLVSNGGTVAVPVTVRVLDPNPVLEVVSSPLLGTVTPDLPLSAFVQVRNAGIGMLTVKAESENPLVTVTPLDVEIPPGPPVRFNLTIPIDGLPGGDHEVAIRLTSNGGSGRAVVRYRLPAELLDVPAMIDLGDHAAGRRTAGTLRITNTGQDRVTLRVYSEDQRIHPGAERITINPGDTVPLPFRLDIPSSVFGPLTSSIVLEGRRVRYTVAVRAVVRKVELIVRPGIVMLGELIPGEIRAFEVEVFNTGEIAAEIPEMHVPGDLEVWMSPAVVHPGERVTVHGRACAKTKSPHQHVNALVPISEEGVVRCVAQIVSSKFPSILSMSTIVGGILAGGATTIAAGWAWGLPIALCGFAVAVWIIWQEIL